MPSLDSTTVVFLTAFQLIATGSLGLLLSRRLPFRGTRRLAGALALFGGSFMLRLLVGPASYDAQTVVIDVIPVLAVLMLIQGLRAFHERAGLPRWGVLTLLGAYCALHLAVIPAGGPAARVLLQSGVVGSLFFATGVLCLRETLRQKQARRHPLVLMGLLTLGIGVAAAARFVQVAHEGANLLYRNTSAQIFYVYTSLSSLLLVLGLLWMLFSRMHGELEEFAARDALTNSLNRHGLRDALRLHFARPSPSTLAFLQVDVDHFKQINDSWGHETGDRVLRAVSDALHSGLRSGDFVARVGGEEFLLGSVVNDHAEALALAERLRQRIEGLPLEAPDGSAINCTVSIGVSAPVHARANWQSAVRAADDALYRAKSEGRNCVRSATPQAEAPAT